MMNYFKFFTEVWRFFKKYYNRPGKEQDYAESVQECSQLAKSFGNGDFVDRVLQSWKNWNAAGRAERRSRMEIIGIIVFCGGIICAAALLLNRPECEKDPREDQEQMEYLEAWKKKHERTDKEK